MRRPDGGATGWEYSTGARLDSAPDDPPGAHPQLQHRGAHRPRQEHARRSAARGDPHHRPAPDDEPGARLDGPRAREGDHHQGPRRAPPVRREGRADLRPEPDRHARPRRLHLRGEPIAPGLRGRDPGRRRQPGDRGPDARQRAPGAGAAPRHHPGHQQDRPRLGRPRDGARPSSRRRSPSRARRRSWPRPRRGPASTEILEAIVKRIPPPSGEASGAAPGARLRQPLRPVQGRGRLRARRERHAPRPRADPLHGDRRRDATSSSSATSGRSRSRPVA